MHLRTVFASLCLSTSLACAALAQPAPLAAGPTAAAPDAATLKVAREVVAQMTGDRAMTLNGIAASLSGFFQQMGIKEPDHAQVLAQEVVLPMFTAHYDEFLDIQARSLASVIGKEDLQALGAFYASPAGRRFAAAQPQLGQALITGMTQWISGMEPEMEARLDAAIKARGWGPGWKAQ